MVSICKLFSKTKYFLRKTLKDPLEKDPCKIALKNNENEREKSRGKKEAEGGWSRFYMKQSVFFFFLKLSEINFWNLFLVNKITEANFQKYFQ